MRKVSFCAGRTPLSPENGSGIPKRFANLSHDWRSVTPANKAGLLKNSQGPKRTRAKRHSTGSWKYYRSIVPEAQNTMTAWSLNSAKGLVG